VGERQGVVIHPVMPAQDSLVRTAPTHCNDERWRGPHPMAGSPQSLDRNS